ncbi:DUF4919 domain-containing protein [Undibacterium sp. RTI2.1]|uniref:DUF4919 domain-containing protein n=1 Tax=unclassified Undibacterium TaxID=2630295 RepID=UPI002AB4D54A|nr:MULTISPECIES: DUF4919 domain-containing protein [unclassified Undibacterium]MDY7540753.1 DUF4919 domain-containing protein [Undibacterium sp. 5I1]MEB0033237.1 DUF4919 domain-containing protein [Undibacterium sp. RTI2.1]MEB0119025.1 DUF4919 domain-containing protein [Undibacterium sp. RTI2.2]MEB0233259.1 DUF4919 domain-containing protein [Undibacterium sp. 10I3]MEB0259890.1 DUF4919 domain-containing protein [Undibacterium sp. 5I1]
MKLSKSCLLLVLIVSIPLVSKGQSNSSESNKENLPIADWNADVNFKNLRTEYGAMSRFEELCDDHQVTQKMVVAMNTKNDDDILKYTHIRLGTCPVDIGAHLYLATALQRKGQSAEMAAHFRWATGLMKSILDTGDGKSSRTAYEVISIAEEKQVVSYFRLRIASQSLETSPYRDRIESVDQTGAKQIIYFNPDAYFKRLQKKLNIKVDLDGVPENK